MYLVSFLGDGYMPDVFVRSRTDAYWLVAGIVGGAVITRGLLYYPDTADGWFRPIAMRRVIPLVSPDDEADEFSFS